MYIIYFSMTTTLHNEIVLSVHKGITKINGIGKLGLFIPFPDGMTTESKEFKYFKKIKADNTITEKNLTLKHKQIPTKLCAVDLKPGEGMIVPRIYALKNPIPITKTHHLNTPLSKTRQLNVTTIVDDSILRQYQHVIVNYILNVIFPKQYEIAYLNLSTGLGKTRIGCGLIALLKVPTLVVVPTKAIAQQWKDEMNNVFPELLTELYTNTKDQSNSKYDVLIIIINSFRDKSMSFMEGFGFTILDEAHEYCSPCSKKALDLAQSTEKLLGLSASPNERVDQLDRFVNLFLGEPIIATSIPDFGQEPVIYKGEVTAIYYFGAPEYTEVITNGGGTISAIKTVENILKDPFRLRLVVNEIRKLYFMHEKPNDGIGGIGKNGLERTHGIIVFVELREYLTRLKAELLELMGPQTKISIEDDDDDSTQRSCVDRPEQSSTQPIEVDTLNVSTLKGGCSNEELSNAKSKDCRIILTTYGYTRRGVSITDATCIIFASPRKSGMTQILGRITRLGSDETITRQIVDIIDTCSPLKGQFQERKHAYELKNYPITSKKVYYGNVESSSSMDS